MRSQEQMDYALAIQLVGAVDRDYPMQGSASQLRVRQRYGRLCHDFPIMVRNSGLAQTAAFYRAKEASGTGQAFRLVLEQVAMILGLNPPSAGGLEQHILSSDMRTYREDSMRVWDAWVYFKRLAVSTLGVEAGDDTDLTPRSLERDASDG